MSSLRDLLLLGRIHTSALTQAILLIGYLLAGERDFWTGAGWCLLGVLFHYAGFLQNNLADLEHDRRDPSKRGHPLVRGSTSVEDARLLAWGVAACASAVLVALTSLQPAPVVVFIVCIVAGLFYNLRSKRNVIGAHVGIALCFGLLPLVPFLTYQSLPSPLVVLVTAFCVLQSWFMNAVAGSLKDLEADGDNLLTRAGVRVVSYAPEGKSLLMTLEGALVVIIGKMGGLFLLLPIVGSIPVPAPLGVLLLVVVLSVAVAYLLAETYSSGPYNRERRLRYIALTEVVTYILLVVVLWPLFENWLTGFLVLYPVAWYIFWVRAYWPSRWVTPEV